MLNTLLFALAATTPSPAPLTPTGPWVVRAEESMCLLERNYPVGAQRTSLIFQPLLDTGQMEIYVIEEKRNDQQYQGSFTARVEPDGQPVTGHYFSAVSPRVKARLTRLSLDRALLDGLNDGDRLRIQAKPVDRVFTISRPDKARVALQGCITELKKSWGIDPERSARAVTAIEGNPARFFGPESYPREAYSKGIYGRVVALLNIDETGAVADCHIVSSAGTALNEGTCKAARRIRFKPPLDKDGKPLAATYTLPVRWVLPGSPDY